MSALLSVDGVSKRFRGLVAVDRVSFEVPEGAIFAVIGPNGAGKTTLFNMIAGVFTPDGGTITFAGERIDGLAPDQICRRGIGRTFQIVRPFPALTVEDNVIVGALLHRPHTRDARAHALEVLRRLDLYDKRGQRASSLTLPDRKRLEVARALATDPKLLLLDEVMAGLRPTETDRMVDHPAGAQPRDRPDHPADRARHARGDGARRPHSGAASRRGDRGRAAGRSRARSRRDPLLSGRGGCRMMRGRCLMLRSFPRKRESRVDNRGAGKTKHWVPAFAGTCGTSLMLKVENLDVFYGDAQALDGVSLEIEQGAIVAIVGANGAGKTSLIRTIAGMHKPARGRIVYRGQDIAGWPSHKVCDLGIGQVAEGRQVFPALSVAENLEMGAMLPRARAARAQNLEKVYAMFPVLAERRGQSAGTLSGGEQQMLAIGRCLMGAPELVMFDEPSLGLAPAIVQNVLKTVRDLNREGLTCVLVEQNVAVSLKLASHAYVLENGRVTLAGSGEALLGDDRVRQAYLGL